VLRIKILEFTLPLEKEKNFILRHGEEPAYLPAIFSSCFPFSFFHPAFIFVPTPLSPLPLLQVPKRPLNDCSQLRRVNSSCKYFVRPLPPHIRLAFFLLSLSLSLSLKPSIA
jgi:hypothetical protein